MGNGNDAFEEFLEMLGYAYDPHEDIFYSIVYPWQRQFGYCRLYDEAAAPLGMIIDCEPIYFEYEGKKWLIEFWKGQYGMTTGCEIGVYTTTGPSLNIPGVFNGTFYEGAAEEDFLQMAYSLYRNGKAIFMSNGRHWWLTGFRLGMFSEPWELKMYIIITLKNSDMRNAFLEGLNKAGYSDREIEVYGDTVNLKFDSPRTRQPITRIKAIDTITQRKNKLFCETYQEITRGLVSIEDKIKAVEEKAPELHKHIARLGKSQQLFSAYQTIKKYLKQ